MMVNKTSLLGFLDEVAKERGFDKFSHLTDVGLVYTVYEIIKEAGKRYVNQYLEIAAENAMINICDVEGQEEQVKFERLAFAGDEAPCTIEINKESITNTEIDT